ncbi:MAG: hypothetical protein QXK12_07105 [Candidatus Nezhaarchaeales archaeon]
MNVGVIDELISKLDLNGLKLYLALWIGLARGWWRFFVEVLRWVLASWFIGVSPLNGL